MNPSKCPRNLAFIAFVGLKEIRLGLRMYVLFGRQTMSQNSSASKCNKNLQVNAKIVHKKPSEIAICDQKSSITNRPVCRICQTATNSESLISPCNCKGTLAHIHLSCLERWLNQSGRNFCELCHFRYQAVETQRYRLCESLRLWICHPRNRRHIRADIIIALLLTLITTGLLFICIYGMDYFTMQAEKVGIDKIWIQFCLISFLVIIVLGYIVSLYLLVRDHLVPWYNWWSRTVNIRLQIPCRRTEMANAVVV